MLMCKYYTNAHNYTRKYYAVAQDCMELYGNCYTERVSNSVQAVHRIAYHYMSLHWHPRCIIHSQNVARSKLAKNLAAYVKGNGHLVVTFKRCAVSGG